jgi:hypothetical protein
VHSSLGSVTADFASQRDGPYHAEPRSMFESVKRLTQPRVYESDLAVYDCRHNAITQAPAQQEETDMSAHINYLNQAFGTLRCCRSVYPPANFSR